MKKILFTLVIILISILGNAQSKKSDFISESSKVSNQTSSLEVKYNSSLNNEGLVSHFKENAIIPIEGLVGYYQLDNGLYIDESDSGYNLEEVGAGGSLLPVENRFGEGDKALFFANEYLDLATNTNAFNFNSDSNFSLCVWINLQESIFDWTGLLSNWNVGTGYYLGINPSQGIRWNVGGPIPIDSPQPIPVGEWTHIAVTYDGTTSSIFINGDLVQSGVNNTSIIATPLPFSVGAQADVPTNLFPGVMDDILVYDRVLTNAEIIDIFSTEAVEENVINPVSATTTLSAEFGSNLDNTINGSGLDVFPSLSATHEGTNPGNAFYATSDVGTIDFDLGGSYLVDGLSFWNVNATGPPQTGIQNVIISSSEDGVTYTVIAGSPTVFAEATNTTSDAQQFSFTEVTTSFIRIEVTTNYGSPDFVGFAEVAFSGIEAIVIENVINPVSATTTLTAQFGSSLDNTINGTGLDAFPSLSATHEMTTPGNSFLATNGTGSIDFDLGGSYLVDGLAFWNENAPGPGQTGIQELVISSSEDGVTFTPIAGSPNTFSQVTGSTSPAEQFSFAIVTASYIRFDVVSNYGDPGNLVAFAEVAFSGIEILGTTDNNLLETISLYPNPTRDVIYIDNSSNLDLKSISIYDMNGRLIKQVEATGSDNQRINISDLSPGIYLFHMYNDQQSTVKRVIKK
ncbi:MAG: T9SS type A sorting domain-containing protein [Flavobacteriaceae bacterium]